MNKWHRLHKFFRKFDNLNDRISFSIAGNDYFETGIEYPDINKRFNNYKGWLNSKAWFCIKYEDLIANQSKSIELIADYMISNYKGYINKKEFIENALLNINPNKSHTFRDGGINKWKTFFNDKHKKLFKKYTRDLLIELGYEKYYDW